MTKYRIMFRYVGVDKPVWEEIDTDLTRDEAKTYLREYRLGAPADCQYKVVLDRPKKNSKRKA